MDSHMGKMNVLSKHNVVRKFKAGVEANVVNPDINHFETEISKEMPLTPKRRMSSMSPLLKQDSTISAKQSNLTRRESNVGKKPKAFDYDEKNAPEETKSALKQKKSFETQMLIQKNIQMVTK